jgi:hypothetical protein
MQWIPVARSQVGKVGRREAGHVRQSSAEIKKNGSINSLSHTPLWYRLS